ARRKTMLISAAMNLGKEAGVALEAALPALRAAADTGAYPAEIEGEEIAAILRRWLWTGRQQVPGWDSSGYQDWIRPQPKAPPAAASPPWRSVSSRRSRAAALGHVARAGRRSARRSWCARRPVSATPSCRD